MSIGQLPKNNCTLPTAQLAEALDLVRSALNDYFPTFEHKLEE